MVATGRRQFLSAVGAMFASDVAYDPEVDETRSHEDFVVPDAVGYLAGLWGPLIPVWLHEGRVTVNRFNQRDGAENEPGIAVVADLHEATEDRAPPSWSVQLDGVHLFNYFAPKESRQKTMRVIDARSGRVVFTSAVPDIFMRSQSEADRSPFRFISSPGFQCNGRRHLSRFYATSGVVPYEAYFDKAPMLASDAVRYRNRLREYPLYSDLVRTLNPDFYDWFWRRMSRFPEVPQPIAMCGEEGKLWELMLGAYI